MSDVSGDDYDLKRCAKCAAWIPATATMCAYCGTTSPDVPPARPAGPRLSLRHGFSVTNALIGANVAYLLWALFVQYRWTPGGNMLQRLVTATGFEQGLACTGAYYHARVFVKHEWWRVMAATFLHAGVIHIGFNMMALKQLGDLTEGLLGPAKFLAIYLVCGACSTLSVSAWFAGVQHLPDHDPVVGASGAIFGIAGLLTVFLLRRGSEFGKAVGKSIGRNVVFMLALGFMLPFVSNTAHVGGLVPGALLGFFIAPDTRVNLRPEARRQWLLLAVIAVAFTVVSLGAGVRFSLTHLGGGR